MNMPELAAFVALIADDAERRFGYDDNVAQRDAYAREATLDLWMTQPGVTVAAANRVWCQVRDEIRRRRGQLQEERPQRRLAVEALLVELELPIGHCPNQGTARDLPGALQRGTQPYAREAERKERSGALAAR
jgi:hypothetical protein